MRGAVETRLDGGRLRLPASWRPALAGPLLLGPGDAGQLVLCPEAKIGQAAALLDVQHARLLVGEGVEVALDRRGRVALPARLRKLAGLDDAALLLGQGGWCEVWNPERWRADVAALSSVSVPESAPVGAP